MNTEYLEERMKAAEAFLEIAMHLASRPPYKVTLDASTTDIEKTHDKHIWWRAVTCHMLYSIVFEIMIKVVWALDNQKECRFTHDIATLYNELNEKSRQQVRNTYCEETAALREIGKIIRRKFDKTVEFHSLDEALEANEDTMKGFKYSNKFEGKSSTLGSVIWTGETLWTLPSLNKARFPEALFRYVENRVQKSMKDQEQ